MTDERVFTDIRMQDGSRHFLCLPQTILAADLAGRLAMLPDMIVTGFVASITDNWIDLSFERHRFAIHDPFGEYWFFVADPACPMHVLERFRDRIVTILR